MCDERGLKTHGNGYEWDAAFREAFADEPNIERIIFDSETHLFSSDAQNAYTVLAQANPNSVTAYAVNEFFNYLASIDYELDLRDANSGKIYYDTCRYIVEEAGKRLYQQENSQQ